jgi:hypothetical protein
VIYPYKTTGKLIGLSTVIFIFMERKLEDIFDIQIISIGL